MSLPKNAVTPPTANTFGNEWATGPLGCFSQPATCIRVVCCSCCVVGDILQYGGGNWCLGCCCSGYCIPCAREKLRTKHSLKTTLVQSGCLDDWLACLLPFWNCLSLCQMANEMEIHKARDAARNAPSAQGAMQR